MKENPSLPRVTRTLAEIAQVLGGADRPDDRLLTCLDLLRKLVPYDCCALLEGPLRQAGYTVLTVPPLSPELHSALRTRLIQLVQLMNGEADRGPNPDQGPPTSEQRQHAAVPVVGLNEVVGLLFVEQESDEPYSEDSMRLLAVLAAQVGSYLTSLRLREEEIEHARQLGVALHRLEETDRRKDEFLAMLGHELRNPLGAINSALRILDRHSVDETSRYHRLIDRQIRHLSRIVDDLLDASRVRLGKIVLQRQPTDLAEIARRWFEAFGPTQPVQSHDVKLMVLGEPVVVDGDPVRLEQVFSNLLTNALKYTPAGGQIRVEVKAEGGFGILRVCDSGIGMTQDLLVSAFELFTQADDSLARSQGGLGLGLPLVRSLVEGHGGTIEAFSEGIGKGSEFIVRLPLSAAARTGASPEDAVDKTSRGPLRVLVIEDNSDACDMLQEMIRLWDHEVDGASDGHQGLSQALAGRYDVLLVDIGLPGLDGYQIARRIRSERGAQSPFLVAMTGYGEPEHLRRATDAGFNTHHIKPVDAVKLQRLLETVAAAKMKKE